MEIQIMLTKCFECAPFGELNRICIVRKLEVCLYRVLRHAPPAHLFISWILNLFLFRL